MKGIDSHQHFWHYHPGRHGWIDDEMALIRKDFLPPDLLPLLKQNNLDGCVAVQADQSEAETDFLLKLANEHSFIKGIVGWVDLCAENTRERLAYYSQFRVIKGFRHVLQAESPDFMLQPKFLRGIASLKEFGFTYDILIYPNHLSATINMVRQFPGQLFVLDHMAKPSIRAGRMDNWKKEIQELSHFENVYCKMSGLVTEADYHFWKKEDFAAYLNVVTESFGNRRIMFGSDWPVCLVAAPYEKVLTIVQEHVASFSVTEQEDIFRNNAISFYQLEK